MNEDIGFVQRLISRGNYMAASKTSAAGIIILAVYLMLAGFANIEVEAGVPDPDTPAGIEFEQRLDARIPLDLQFRDDAGRHVTLGDYFGEKPAVLALIYYECPAMCGLILNGMLQALKEIPFTIGEEFNVIVLSIDPDETHVLASSNKERFLREYGRQGILDGAHFLVGEESQTRSLADSVGYEYRYVQETGEYAHPSGIVIITPDGRVSKYFYGITYPPRDMRLGLAEASENRIGSAVDRFLLFCYEYDPATGEYGLLVMRVINTAGFITVGALGLFLVVMLRRERRGELSVTGKIQD